MSATRRGRRPREDSPPAAPRSRRHAADIGSILAAYAFVAIGGWIYLRDSLKAAPDLPGVEAALPLLVLGLVPLALVVFLGLRARLLFLDWRRKRYGSALRLRLSLLFLLIAAVASLPQGIFLLRLAWGAQAWPAGVAASTAAREGLALVLDYYGQDLERLKRLASLPLAAPPRRPAVAADAAAAQALAALRDLEPRIEALEFLRADGPYAFAGEPTARLGQALPTGAAGWLPSATGADSAGTQVTRLRYAAALGDRAAEGGASPRGAASGTVAVVTMRLPQRFEGAAAALSSARDAADRMAPFSLDWGRRLGLIYLFLVLPLLALAALLGVAAADLVAEPLASLEAATRRVASGDFGARLLAKPGDETGRLAAAFNRMLDVIERRSEGDLRRGRMDAWHDIAQRLAHELKNPLTPIRLAAERVLRLARSDPARALEVAESSMLAVIAEVEGMDALLSDFRAFASLPEPQRDWAELAPLVEEAVAVWKASYPEVEFDLSGLPEALPLRLDRAQFKRALGNLVSNALDAMGGRGRITIAGDLVKAAESRYCRLRVADTGRGIPAGLGDHVFDPYFTTKSAGTGLGLSIVERIVEDHGGSIRFESEEGAGATFIIDLPVDR